MFYFSKSFLTVTLAGTVFLGGCVDEPTYYGGDNNYANRSAYSTVANNSSKGTYVSGPHYRNAPNGANYSRNFRVNTANMTPTEIALRQQQTERTRVVSGVATGAVVGALAGAAIGALAGGNSKAATRGALIGGLGGGVVGGIDANNVNQRTRVVASQQQTLHEIIASADKNIAYYRKATTLTQKLAREDAVRLKNSKQKLVSGKLKKAAYNSEVASAKSNAQLVDEYVKNANQDIYDLKRTTAGDNSAATKQRVAQLTAERDKLKNQLTLMQQAISRAG